MARIPDHILNEIQDRCDIVEIISSYIPLRPAGRNFKALCPFHHEKTPSFIVSPDKQIYHCFGCNSGGNVFNFVKEYEKIDFIDAVKMLAEKTGVKLPIYQKEDSQTASITGIIYNINDITANYYENILERLPDYSEVKQYLIKRGLQKDTIKKFRIGFAESSWRGLLDYLEKRGLHTDIILKAGLVQKGKDSSLYDLFRNRIIFPIFDIRGKVLGFGARVLDDSLPKYINSPETMVYKKAEHLYGLNFAKTSIKDKNFAIITEGYMDVITSHQHGIENVVSSLGTALTVEQIRLLKRHTHNVVMIYDADQAGEMATLRGLDLFLEEGMNVRIVALEKGHDPDSFIRKFGAEKFNLAISKAGSLFTYKLDILKRRFNINEPESKAELVKEMLLTIDKVRNAIVKAEYVKLLAQEISVREDAIWDELKKLKSRRSQRLGRIDGEVETYNKQSVIEIPIAEKILLKLMMEDAKAISVVKDNLTPDDFKSPFARILVEAIFDFDKLGDSINPTRLINRLEGKVEPYVISYIVNEELEIKDRDKNLTDCIKAIKRDRLAERLGEIQNRLSLAQKNGYEDQARSLLEEFNKLIKKGV